MIHANACKWAGHLEVQQKPKSKTFKNETNPLDVLKSPKEINKTKGLRKKKMKKNNKLPRWMPRWSLTAPWWMPWLKPRRQTGRRSFYSRWCAWRWDPMSSVSWSGRVRIAMQKGGPKKQSQKIPKVATSYHEDASFGLKQLWDDSASNGVILFPTTGLLPRLHCVDRFVGGSWQCAESACSFSRHSAQLVPRPLTICAGPRHNMMIYSSFDPDFKAKACLAV